MKHVIYIYTCIMVDIMVDINIMVYIVLIPTYQMLHKTRHPFQRLKVDNMFVFNLPKPWEAVPI